MNDTLIVASADGENQTSYTTSALATVISACYLYCDLRDALVQIEQQYIRAQLRQVFVALLYELSAGVPSAFTSVAYAWHTF